MISFIIPVYNDPEGLEDTLNSIVNQELEEERYEVLVVDNGSTDDTSKVIKRFSDQNSNIKGLEEDKIQSSYAARNKGIENSKGRIICFLDADMFTEKTYLSDIKNYFEENQEVDYIGCRVEMVNNSDTITGRYNKLKGFPIEKYMDEKGFAPTCCLSVRKKVFSSTGLFNQELISGGDKLFGKKAKNKGLEMRYVDEIKVFHPVRDNWREIRSKYFRMGRGWYQKRILEEKKMGEEEVNLRKILPIVKKVVVEAKYNFKDETLGLKEVLAFAGLTCVKKLSMFSGYQYQRILFYLDRD